MYTPAQFVESRLPLLHDLIRKQPFAAIVAATGHGLDAEHVPLFLDDSRGDYGVLQGHVARANPIWQELQDGTDVLVLFQGAQHYISPSWYPSKQQDGRVVPTWNYMIVHARGRINWLQEREWLRQLLEKMTNSHEQNRAHPWRVADAPGEYVERMLESIVGFEVAISSLTGKWKLSQNRTASDRAGVISALETESSSEAFEMAEQMREARGS
jgi:transcriptional regulator